jgi:hypothetical protein
VDVGRGHKPRSTLTELESEVWKAIPKTILKHPLKIFYISKTLDVTENNMKYQL